MVPYPLATSYFGVEHVAILEHVISGTVLSIPGVGSQPALIDVSLEPDTYSNGWRVRSEFGFIGFLDEVEAAEYPDLHRLKASQATPQTVATVGIVDGELEVAVSLGLWPWMVPVNDQPAESALLAGGHGAVIDSAAGDLTDEQLSHLETQQFFVTLKVIDDAVVASCGDTVVGPCGVLSQLPGLRAAYAAAQEAGTVLAARAYSGGGMIAVDIPAEDATDTELFSPAVPPLRVPSGRTALPSTTTSRPTTPAQPEGWEFALESADIAGDLPTGSRRPVSPSANKDLGPAEASPATPSTAPENDAAPTTPRAHEKNEAAAPPASSGLADLVSSMPGSQNLSWRALPVAEEPGRFSSESARVRARRVAREQSRPRGGNHRK
ncbi:hypothetical protein NLL38_02325 [Corynebacterium accolens]|jgi:hypothetical protein|uniref:hypothetical protein n=1 Tax=Corynebacterium accolens TaxID=38284 RepID=UPI001EDAF4E7|nr:hypothetical protein [Corynebacterium accolens]MDK4294792.1 hypothetical protein [Corynebacterium accolens]WKS63241.1 hypothetical protein NLL39_04045 [Corynebacterium accolens]WKS69492.1 hypothetical protein NLL40_02325 [Corynebacterium accolens]WKS71769.1 hypothetical protein NLL38_02325 [Corynebacterium accolens]WKS73811.1 hypothetical protein NLL44_01065 [Corynebacterium accolens]